MTNAASATGPGIGATAAPFGYWERMLAGRYLRAKRSQGGVALISVISFIGIMLAVAVLIIVMSVMNGFRSEMLTRILGFQGHVYVTGGVLDGVEREAAVQRLRQVPGVIQVAPIVEAQAIALGPTQISGAIVRGIGAKDLQATTMVAQNITKGSLKDYGAGEFGGETIVVGARLAESLGVAPGDVLTLISPSGGATAFGGTPMQKEYVVGATFAVGMSQYDQAYIFMPFEQAQLFFGREGTADAIEVRVNDPDHAARMKPQLGTAAGPAGIVTDWTQRDSSFWGALKIERVMMRLILMLLVAIAAMNIISGLVMLVKNKGRDIAILRTIGAGQGAIMRIFFMAGASIGVLGTIAGLVLGIVFCAYITPIQHVLEAVTGAVLFSSDVYFLDRVPAKIDWAEVLIITTWALGMSFVATLAPAWRASRIDPVEALRYE